jgi:hypothetical protein
MQEFGIQQNVKEAYSAFSAQMIRVVQESIDDKMVKVKDKIQKGLEMKLLEQVDKINQF